MSKSPALLFALIAALIAPGCAHPISVNTQFDARANFSSMRTFAWSGESDSTGDASRALRPEMSRHIRSEVESALAAKGLHKSTPADVIVEFSAAVDQQQQKIQMFMPKPAGGTPQASEWVAQYDRGTLAIILTDRASGQAVWFSSAQADIERDGVNQQVSAAITKMFAGFPPPKPK